jgi:ATP-dependent RNA helicase SUPV3L1/SUV3
VPGAHRPRHHGKWDGKRDGKRDGKWESKGDGKRDRRGRPMFASSAPPRREKVADPNSPFAKLAALKQQLEDAKEKR